MSMNTTTLETPKPKASAEHDDHLLSATDPNGQAVQSKLNTASATRGGRPSKLTRERQHIIVEALTHGASLSTAARLAAISERTVFRWKARGLQESAGPYHVFIEAVVQVFTNAQTPQNALSPMQVELFALLARAMAATPWQERESFEEELIQLLADKPVIPSRPHWG